MEQTRRPAIAYVALGSNQGDRKSALRRALELMNGSDGITVRKVSRFIQTAPEGGPPGQADYFNAVAEIETTLSPHELLRRLQQIETALGRKRQREKRWGPRPIDLDILMYGEEIISNDTLIVPHPLMHQRRFVMEPLAEIAPQAVHPMLQMTAAAILQNLVEPPLP